MPLCPVVNGRGNPIKPLPLFVSQRDASHFTLVRGAIPAYRSAVVEHQQDRGALARVRRNDLPSVEFNLDTRVKESFGRTHQEWREQATKCGVPWHVVPMQAAASIRVKLYQALEACGLPPK